MGERSAMEAMPIVDIAQIASSQSASLDRPRRWKKVLLWVAAFLLFIKLDNLLWGYLAWPVFNVFTALGLVACLLVLLVRLARWILAKYRFRSVRFWTRWAIAAGLGFLAFEPCFPSPLSFYILGYSLRVRTSVNLPEVRKWAQDFQFPAEDSPATQLAWRRCRPVQVSNETASLGVVGWGRTDVYPDNRSVHAWFGSVSGSHMGIIIGPDAIPKVSHWNFWSWKMGLKLADDVYVWTTMP